MVDRCTCHMPATNVWVLSRTMFPFLSTFICVAVNVAVKPSSNIFPMEISSLYWRWGNNFRFNSKCSLLKLLCTLARLYKGTPLQPHILDFLSHPRSTLHISIFCRHDNITRGKAHRPSARSTTQSAHYRDIAPLPTSQL